MHVSLSLHVVIAVLNLGIGIYVLYKNPKSIINRAFFVFVFGVVGWSLGVAAISWTENFAWVVPTLWSSELIVLGLVVLSEVFPEEQESKEFSLTLLAPLLLLFLIAPGRLFIAGVRFNANGYLEPENGPLFPLFVLVMGAYIIFSFVNFLRGYRKASGIRRVQVRYLITGAIIFVTAGFLFDILLPAFHIFALNLIGPLFSIVFIGLTGYAIVRYQLMDIRVVIKRGITYLCVIGAIAGFFFTFEFVVEKFYYNDQNVDIVAAIVGAFIFARFRAFFDRITDRIFFRGDYDYAESVRTLGVVLNSTIDLRELLALIDDFLGKTIKPRSVVFLLEQEGEPVYFARHESTQILQQRVYEYRSREKTARISAARMIIAQEEPSDRNASGDIAAIVPLFSKERVSAVMLLGEKLSDDILRPKDIQLLSVISHQAGIAIENARLYAKVQQHNEELEEIVEERTKKIKEMYEAQAKFLTDISHQLQTPIAVLRGNLELAESRSRDQAKTSMRIIRTTLDGMAELVANFLEIARLNFSKNKFHKTRFDIGELLGETYEDCLILAETKGIWLTISKVALFVFGDRQKLKEVVLNLISNALKYTVKGGTIALEVRQKGDDAEVTVQDTGVGIAPEDIGHIFERFYKIPGAGPKGNGLGLNICRQIVEFHGGTITVNSVQGGGSCFVIRLPLDS